MYCGKCGTQIPDNAVFCPVCGNKNENAITEAGLDQHQTNWQTGTGIVPPGAQTPIQQSNQQMPPSTSSQGINMPSQSAQSSVQGNNGWNMNVQPDAGYQQMNNQQVPKQNYSPVQLPNRDKNKKVLIIVIAIISVLLIIAIISTIMLVKQLRDDDDNKSATSERMRTTTEALVVTEETTTRETTTVQDNDEDVAETTPEVIETTPEQTEPADIPADTMPGLVPDYIWEYTDFAAELADYAGHYKGSITTNVANLERIYIFQEDERQDIVDTIMGASSQEYFTDLFVEEDSLEAFSEHPLSYEDGSFLYLYPLELTAGGYFEEYSNPSFDGTDVSQYGYIQTAFYQLPGQPPSFYLLNYEEYEWEGELAYFEVRIDVQLVE